MQGLCLTGIELEQLRRVREPIGEKGHGEEVDDEKRNERFPELAS